MEEIWKDVVGYEGYYQVSNLGRIKSLERRINSSVGTRVVKPQYKKYFINDKGYYTVNLSLKGKNKTISVHRIVSKAFIPNPENKPAVNHKDMNKLNNSLENLEWVTYQENTNHALENHSLGHNLFKYHNTNNAIKRGIKKIRCVELDKVFDSAVEACKQLNLNTPTLVRSSANKKSKLEKAYGYTWEYV